MASLTGQTISSTYDSLLKVSDNEPLTGTLKQITDGLGNNSALSLSTNGASITGGLSISGTVGASNLSGTNTGDETYSSIISKLGFTPVGGTGSAGRVAKFSDSDTLTNANIYTAGDEIIGEMIGIGADPNGAPTPHRLFVSGNSYLSGSLTSTGNGTFSGNMRSLRAWIGPSSWSSGSAPIHAYTDSIGPNPLLRLQNGGSVNSNELSSIWLENYAGFRGELKYTSLLDSNRFIINNNAGSGTLEFQTGSSERMRITGSGNVGIGTTSPSFKLTTNFSAPSSFTNAAGDFVQMWQASGTNGLGVAMSTGDSVARLVTNNGYQLAITAGGTETARFTSSGNVGIGTTSPDSAGGYSTLSVNGSSGGQITWQTSGTKEGYIYNTSSALIVGADTGNNLIFDAGANERMRITSGGNVGIGTASPGEKLEVQNGAAGAKIKVSNSGGGYASLECSSNATSVAQLTFTNQLSLIGGNVGIGTTSPNAYSGFTGLTLDNGTNGGVLSIRKNGITYLNIYSGTDLANIYTEGGSTNLILGTGGSERMRITSGGSALIGTSTDNAKLTIYNNSGVTSYPVIATQHAASTGVQFATHINFLNSSGSQAGFISANGTSTFYGTSSDYRLKKDLKDYSGLSLVGNIKTYDYQWESDESRMYGVLAHELAEVLPYAVNGEKDGEMMQAVDYSKIVPVLVKAIQELTEKVNQLENK